MPLLSRDGFELLVRRPKFRIGLIDHFRRGAPERLLRWNSRKPALLGKFLVRRKIKLHQQFHFAVRGGFRFCCRKFAGSSSTFRRRLPSAFSFRSSSLSRLVGGRWFVG